MGLGNYGAVRLLGKLPVPRPDWSIERDAYDVIRRLSEKLKKIQLERRRELSLFKWRLRFRKASAFLIFP